MLPFGLLELQFVFLGSWYLLHSLVLRSLYSHNTFLVLHKDLSFLVLKSDNELSETLERDLAVFREVATLVRVVQLLQRRGCESVVA